LGLSSGILCGLVLFAMTLVLVLRGGVVVGPHLGLLGQFFPGYTVSRLGSLVGLGYGFSAGFVAGWAFAVARNVITFLHWTLVRRRAERGCLRRFLEYV